MALLRWKDRRKVETFDLEVDSGKLLSGYLITSGKSRWSDWNPAIVRSGHSATVIRSYLAT
jgi:hypothetical protein